MLWCSKIKRSLASRTQPRIIKHIVSPEVNFVRGEEPGYHWLCIAGKYVFESRDSNGSLKAQQLLYAIRDGFDPIDGNLDNYVDKVIYHA